jgi:uncharacterized protein
MKKTLFLSLVFLFTGSLLWIPQADALRFYSFGTAGTGGTYYVLGAGFSAHINKYYKQVRVTAEVTSGAVENYNLLKRGKLDFIFSDVENPMDDLLANAYGGGAKEKVRVFMPGLFTSDYQWFLRKGAPIKDLCDLKGKKVGVGPHGSNTLVYNLKILKALCGLEPDKEFKAYYYPYAESCTAIRDNTIDLGTINAGYPTASLIDLSATVNIDLISLSDKEIEQLQKSIPTLIKIVIPAGTYKGIDHDVNTVSHATVISCRPDLPEDDVYGIIKALFTNLDERNAVHPQAKKFTINAMVEVGSILTKKGLPFHSGVVKYLKEVGAWKPELEVK